MEKIVNLAFYAQVVDEGITIEVAKLKGVSLQSKAPKRCGDDGFDNDNFLQSYKALEILDKEYYVPVINVFIYRHYLAFFMRSIEMQVEIIEICLILPFYSFWLKVRQKGNFARCV